MRNKNWPKYSPLLAVRCAVALSCCVATAAWPADPALIDAVRRGDHAAAQSALRQPGVSVDDRARDSMTALLWASQANDLELARLLLDGGADPNAGNRHGVTPLWLAATNRSAELVALLLRHGADPRAALPNGETALMAAARAGDADSIELLLKAGADPNAHEALLGETALMWAAAENHAAAIRALATGGADLNMRTAPLDLGPMNWRPTGMGVAIKLPEGGWTALMLAARENAQDAARALAEGGANLNLQDEDGTTALGIAITNAHYDLAAQLLELGADPNVADVTGMNALYGAVDMATLGSVIGRPKQPEFDTLRATDIVRLALDHGANPNAQLTEPILPRHHQLGDRALGAGATALMRATKSFDVESMRLLLAAGADPNLALKDGSNAAFFIVDARRRGGGDDEAESAPKEPVGKREALQMLVEAGADINAIGARGETPLHRALREGDLFAARLFLEHGARRDARDAEGRTPLDLVAENGPSPNADAVALLQAAVRQ